MLLARLGKVQWKQKAGLLNLGSFELRQTLNPKTGMSVANPTSLKHEMEMLRGKPSPLKSDVVWQTLEGDVEWQTLSGKPKHLLSNSLTGAGVSHHLQLLPVWDFNWD